MRALVSSGDDKDLKVWDASSRKFVGMISTHGNGEIRSETIYIP